MGRDKSRLRLGSLTLLGHVRREARKLGLRVRLVRKDLVPRCGPLGGVYTALKTSREQAEIILACDMPFVSVELLESVVDCWQRQKRAAFVSAEGRPGFPLLLPCNKLPIVERQIARREFSLKKLAVAVKARLFRVRGSRTWELFNVNTPADWRTARHRAARNDDARSKKMPKSSL